MQNLENGEKPLSPKERILRSKQKPALLKIQPENIPDELKAIPQYIPWGWRWDDAKGRWGKPPLDWGGNKSNPHSPANWRSFDDALAAVIANTRDFSGLGLSMGDGSGYVGFDIDDCRDPVSGVLSAEAQAIVDDLDTYVEVSPSGCGIKGWLRGDFDSSKYAPKKGNYEAYRAGRYFTVTGHSLGNRTIAKVGPKFYAFLDKHLAKESTPKPAAKSQSSYADRDPDETLRLAAEAIKHLDPSCDYNRWYEIGMSLSQFGEKGLQLWNEWSSNGADYPGESDLRDKWKSFKVGHGITVGTLFHYAKEAGYQFPKVEGIGVTEGQTDIANARRLVDEYGDRLRYVHDWKRWLYFDGRRWVNNHTQVESIVQKSAKKLWPEIGLEIEQRKLEREAIGKMNTFVKQSNCQRGLAATLRTAEADQRVAISYLELDSHPTLLNCRNGTLNIETGELSPHSSDQMLTQMANVDFDAGASCPQWLNTLDLVFDGDLVLFSYAQELIGYTLAGGNPSAILPIFHGNGNNGKSTIWLTVVGLLGDYAMVGNRELVLGSRTEHQTMFADLYKKRLVAVAEPEEGSSLKEAEVKRLTGSDNIRARRMREDHWEFAPTHTLWIASNHKPKVNGNDEGIWRRLKLIPFDVDLSKVTTPKIDFHLWLLENEAAGILNWAIRGYRRWQERGGKFADPEIVKMATAEYREAEDVWGQWIAAYCETAGGYEERADRLYEKYTDTNGRATYKTFCRELKSRFQSYEPTSGENRKKLTFVGLRISPIFGSVCG